MTPSLPDAALDQLFRTARTYNAWTAEPVGEAQLRELYELLKWAPTAANCCPARFVWVSSDAGKARLAALAMEGNRAKILQAPLTVIVGEDLAFGAAMPRLFPERGAQLEAFFSSDPGLAATTASRNSSLQGAYLILAARALGLDCGPMSGFDQPGVDREFFAGTRIRSNFICSLGHGSSERLFPRLPRLSFDEVGRFA